MLMTVLKWLSEVWQWVNEPNIISAFLVTMLGVWAAFRLTGWGEKRARNRTTKQRLHTVVLESHYASVTAKDIVDDYADSADLKIQTDRPHTTAAAAALEDPNVVAFLPLHKVLLLRSYVDGVAILNEALEAHQRVVENARYESTAAERPIRDNVRSTAAALVGTIIVLQEELSSYFDGTTYDDDEARRIEDRLKNITAKAEKGEFSLSKEE